MNHSTIHRTRTGKRKQLKTKLQECWGPRTKPFTFVKKDPQCSHVETVRWQETGSIASMLWDRGVEEELAKLKNIILVVERKNRKSYVKD